MSNFDIIDIINESSSRNEEGSLDGSSALSKKWNFFAEKVKSSTNIRILPLGGDYGETSISTLVNLVVNKRIYDILEESARRKMPITLLVSSKWKCESDRDSIIKYALIGKFSTFITFG